MSLSESTNNVELSPQVATVALFGGVYSNFVALEAALASARVRDASTIFCLGDLGAFGPHPDRTVELLRQEGVATLRGNYDDSLARGLDDCQCGYTDPRDNHFARISYQYTLTNTHADHRRWLGQLPAHIRFELSGARVLLCHGSPRKMNEFLWESMCPDGFLERLFDDYDADVIAVTHSGIKWQRRLPSGRLLVNVGVLGRPENDGRREVWYTLLKTRDGNGAPPARNVEAEFVQVAYDYKRLIESMRTEQLPAEFIETIETGWWTTCLEILPASERLRGRH